MAKSRTLFLFDVDGTLTQSRKIITPTMLAFMKELSSRVTVGIVGGSDEVKIVEQLDGHTEIAEYLFSENGLVAKQKGEIIEKTNIIDKLGDKTIQTFINFCLGYMSKIELPVKRGTFIEFRNGMINVCPVGRSCTQAERDQFDAYDKEHKIREKFIAAIQAEYPDLGMKYSIGGQISFDCFPIGWDKTYCLQYVVKDFDEIIFFGDKTYPGGNDYEIFSDERVKGKTVTSPENTRELVKEELNRIGL